MNKFTNIFKRCVCASAVLTLLLSGCSVKENEKEKNENLDLSEAVISENVPNNGEWYTFRLKSSVRSPTTASCMKNVADALKIPEFDRAKIVYNIYDTPYTPGYDVSEEEMTSSDYRSLYLAYYTSDDFHIDILNNGRTIYNDRRLIRETVGDPEILDNSGVIKAGWMPSNSSEHIKSYDISDDDSLNDKYTLNGAKVSVREGIELALRFMDKTRNLNRNSERITYKPSQISVRKQTDTNYGFYFMLQSFLDGVPMDNTGSGTPAGWGTTLFSIYDLLYINDISSPAYFSANSVYADELVSAEPCKLKYDLDGACAVVSKNLSQEHKFKIISAELIYCADSITDPETNQKEHVIKPMWQFIITNTGMQFGTICVNVDAVSGEMFMRAVQ